MQVIFVPYPEDSDFCTRIQSKLSPEFCHVCVGFKEDDEVWDFSIDGFTVFSYSHYVEPDSDVVIDFGNTRYPVDAFNFFCDKKVHQAGFALWLLKVQPKSQYWCTDFVSMCLDELQILPYQPRRHPKELFDLLINMKYTV